MRKKHREGGIFPPLTLVFPPFAYGAGQALSAVVYCQRFKSITKVLRDGGGDRLVFHLFHLLPEYLKFELKGEGFIGRKLFELSGLFVQSEAVSAIAFVIQNALAGLRTIYVIQVSQFTATTLKHRFNRLTLD